MCHFLNSPYVKVWNSSRVLAMGQFCLKPFSEPSTWSLEGKRITAQRFFGSINDSSLPSSRNSKHVAYSTCGPEQPAIIKTPGKVRKLRLDEICLQRFPQHPPEAIKSWIMQGKVLINGQPVLKPGTLLKENSDIKITAQTPKFVCRAGLKLEAAIAHFSVPVKGVTAMDAGISTGGFTDCLLQHGVAKVYGVDVGYGQVSERVRTDPRVTLLERTNLRLLEKLPELVDLVTLDLSFISILAVLPAVCRILKPGGRIVALIKPQFEASKGQVGEGGIVRDSNVHKMVLAKVVQGMESSGFISHGYIASPITGMQGNIEFLAYFTRNSG